MVVNGKQPYIICVNSSVDRELQEELFKHLTSVNISPFPLDKITAGSNRKAEIEKAIHKANIILLLVSSDFLYEQIGSMHKFLARHATGSARVIPILLRPCPWEDSEIKNLQALPNNSVPVTKWGDKDDAYLNIASDLQKVIADLSDETEESEVEEENESGFNLQDTIALFDYLTIEHHVDVRRIIMHFIAQQSQNLGNQVTEQEIFREVREKRTSPYSQEEIRNDLTFLEYRENLAKTRNFEDTDTIFAESLQLPRDFVYSITPRAMDIESLLDSWRSSKTRRGSLDQYNLLKIKENLEQIHAELATNFDPANDNLVHTVAEKWQSLFQDWQKLATEVPLYLSSLEKDAEKDLSLLENYRQHKHNVVNYIKRFVNTLKEVEPRICDIFAEWKSSLGKKEYLALAIIKHYEQNSNNDDSIQQIARSLRHSTYKEIDKVETWFLEQAPKFYHHANIVIQRLIAWADRISRHKQLKNTTYLHELATLCLKLEDTEIAKQIFYIVFAQALPFHVPPSTLVNPGITDKTETESIWLIPAPYQPIISIKAPISKNIVKPQSIELDRGEARKRLYDDHVQQVEMHKNNHALLLSLMPLDLGTLIHQIDQSFCRFLEEIIDICQCDSHNQYDGLSDSVIFLCNPNEQVYTHICTNEGFFYVPRYCFDWLNT